MMLRSAAVVAGLAVGLMSATAEAASITYNIDLKVGNSTVSGFIETDGKINKPIQYSDILDYSVSAGGLTASYGSSQLGISSSSLSASTNGLLSFSFGDANNYDYFYAVDGNGQFVFQLLGYGNTGVFEPGRCAIYAYKSQCENATSGEILTIGSSPTGMSSVPLPPSAPMFGAALLGLASLGYAAKRKVKTTT